MVLVAIDEPGESSKIWQLCQERRIPANIADVPPECDFYFGSVHRDGPLQIMVSTNGRGPRLASLVRQHIGKTLPEGAGPAIEVIGKLRSRLRELAPENNKETSVKRMRWMTSVSDAYTWKDMAQWDDTDMENLLKFWDAGDVPSIEALKAMKDPEKAGI
jgi:precorrin-2 dehydrogenase/sirohydrochlorin ferrochelatase